MTFKTGDKFMLADWMQDEEDPITLSPYTIEEVDEIHVTISWLEIDGSKDDTTYLIDEVKNFIENKDWLIIKEEN